MRLVLPVLAIASLSSACASSPNASSGSAEAGVKAATYFEETSFLMPTEDGEESAEGEDGSKMVDATDCLSIQPAADGGIRYDFAFNFPYDHMCEMHGEAKLIKPGVWEDVSQENCRLVIDFDGKSWSVNDPDSSCREMWCGARGNIGHSFSTSKGKALTQCGS